MKVFSLFVLMLTSAMLGAAPIAPSVNVVEKGAVGDSKKRYEIQLKNFGKSGQVKLQIFFLTKGKSQLPVAFDYTFEDVAFTTSDIGKVLTVESRSPKEFKQRHGFPTNGPELKGIAVAVLEGTDLNNIPSTKVTAFYSNISGLSAKDAPRFVADPKDRPGVIEK